MNKETLKKYAPVLIGAIVVIVIIIIIVATRHKQENSTVVIPTGDTVATATPTVTTPVLPLKTTAPSKPASGLTMTSVAPQLHFVSQTANASTDTSSTKHGVFLVDFSINAAEKDLYVSPSCHTELSKDGISFSLIENGVPTTDGIGPTSCAVTSVSGVSIQKSGRFMIPAFTIGTFQMVVVAHPTINGLYKVRINQIGYASSDATGTTILPMDSATRDQMQTNTISL